MIFPGLGNHGAIFKNFDLDVNSFCSYIYTHSFESSCTLTVLFDVSYCLLFSVITMLLGGDQ